VWQGLADGRSSAAQIHVRCQEHIYSGNSLVNLKGLATAGNALFRLNTNMKPV